MRAMKIAIAAALLALVACSKKEESGENVPAKGSATSLTCATAIAKAVDSMAAQGAGGVGAKLKTLMTARCEADKWSAAALECYATQATDMRGIKMCRETTLTPEQSQAVMTEIRTVMMSAGSGGGPMHSAPAGSGSAQ